MYSIAKSQRDAFVTLSRSALTIMELTIAVAVLAAVLATSMRMIHVISQHQRADERRLVALEAVQAVSEQVANLPWEELTSESANRVTMPMLLEPYLPGAKLSVTVDEETGPRTKRVRVDISWNGPGNQPTQPVGLTTWVFSKESPTTIQP